MKKSEVYAYIGTVISAIIILLMLFLIVLPGMQTEEEDGIMISFGDVTEGTGVEQPAAQAEAIPEASEPEEQKELLTQKDKSVVIPETKPKPETTKPPKPQPETKPVPEKPVQPNKDDQLKKEQQQAQQADDLIGGSFGSVSKPGSGTTNSDAAAGNPIGKGNFGGNSWSLTGRNPQGTMALPKYNENEDGKVVVEITVNASGVVETARVTKGTTTSNTILQKASIDAAYKTRFTAGTGKVIGTITYNFKLN